MKRRNKTFLSDSADEGGAIIWEVLSGKDTYSSTSKYSDDFVEGQITIKDCSRTIELSLECEQRSHVPKRIKKVQTLIDELEKVKEALEDSIKAPKFYY